jgi:UDP-N-acetylmuramate: L-alanyl-gamma-D-glutamyl-meso-diaminopimelate ligase
MNPGFFIGGIPKNYGQGCLIGSGDCFVSEGDEYDTAYWDKKSKFLHYRPTWVLCTGIEFDHVDIFSSVEMIENSFCELVDKTKKGWVLIDSQTAPLPASVEKIANYAKSKNMRIVRYGRSPESDYQLIKTQAVELPWNQMALGLKIRFKTPKWGEVEVISSMPGEHNALNLLGVVATCIESGELKNVSEVQAMLQTFSGIKRRQDEVKLEKDFVVIDDFAHHPTAIRETIKAIKTKYPKSKIAAFFEARSATSSRKVFEKEFTECFDDADVVFLSPPTKTNIPENEKLNIDNVVQGIQKRKNANFVHSKKDLDDLLTSFKEWSQGSQIEKQHVVALVMSNGPFQGIFDKIARR